MSELRTRTALLLLGLFALMAPLGALIAVPLYEHLRGASLVVPTALAAGTFRYVATMDLLPEAFHEGAQRLAPFVGVVQTRAGPRQPSFLLGDLSGGGE